eukprot:6458019-Amphidinium_carterae.1
MMHPQQACGATETAGLLNKSADLKTPPLEPALYFGIYCVSSAARTVTQSMPRESKAFNKMESMTY